MRTSFAVSLIGRRSNRPVRGCVARIAVGAFAIAGLLTTTGSAAEAQAAPADQQGRWELVIPSGTVIPVGGQRDAIQRGGISALQLSYAVDPAVALTATVGWARSRDIAGDHDRKLDVFTYDLGAELRSAMWRRGSVRVSTFAGLGAGARSYNYRRIDADATHNLAAYGSIGGRLGIGPVNLRVEARDYLSGFRPLEGTGDADARNDITVLFGLSFGTR